MTEIDEQQIEGPVVCIPSRDKDALYGKDERLYEGLIRAYYVMARETRNDGISAIVEGLEKLFPSETPRKRYTVNCRLLICQNREDGISYDIYVLLFKKFLLHFNKWVVHENEAADVLASVESFKTEYKKSCRNEAQMHYFIENSVGDDDVTVWIKTEKHVDENGKTIYKIIEKVIVNGEETKFVCQRGHYPTMAEFEVHGKVLQHLKSVYGK